MNRARARFGFGGISPRAQGISRDERARAKCGIMQSSGHTVEKYGASPRHLFRTILITLPLPLASLPKPRRVWIWRGLASLSPSFHSFLFPFFSKARKDIGLPELEEKTGRERRINAGLQIFNGRVTLPFLPSKFFRVHFSQGEVAGALFLSSCRLSNVQVKIKITSRPSLRNEGLKGGSITTFLYRRSLNVGEFVVDFMKKPLMILM